MHRISFMVRPAAARAHCWPIYIRKSINGLTMQKCIGWYGSLRPRHVRPTIWNYCVSSVSKFQLYSTYRKAIYRKMHRSIRCTSTHGFRIYCAAAKSKTDSPSCCSSTICINWIHWIVILWPHCHGYQSVCRVMSTWYAHRPYPSTHCGSPKCKKSASNSPTVCSNWAPKRIEHNWKNRCQMNRLMATFNVALTNWRRALAVRRDSVDWQRIYRAPNTV